MMDLKNIFTDEDAVSPVIGVILMVAITVILAAVIGAFVLNIGGNQETAPQVQWDYSYDSGASDAWMDDSGETVTIEHGGGGSVDTSTLTYRVSGEEVPSGNISTSANQMSAGDTITITLGSGVTGSYTTNPAAGDEVQVVWTSSSGETTQVISTGTLP